MRKSLVIAAALLILLGVNFAIYEKEALLRDGRVVLLELAPVDPRSLMQGDYMALRFRAANEAFAARLDTLPKDGRVILALDDRDVAVFRRFDDGAPPTQGEVMLRYRIRDNQVKFAANAYFFQEGHGAEYAQARYGEFRVADNGESVLTALRDQDLNRLGAGGGPSE